MLNIKTSGNGYPIVFLHGALVDHSMWDNQKTLLEKQYKVILVDLPNHGLSSDLEQEFTIENVADAIIKVVIDKLDYCLICGHSLGGMVCQYIAISRPQIVKGIILAETSFGTKNNLSEKIQSALAEFFLLMVNSRTIINASINQYGKLSKTTREYIKTEMGKYNIKQIRKVMSAALNYEGRKNLNSIKCKALILVSEKNKQTHNQANIMNNEIPNSDLIIITQSHHLLNLDNENEFNEKLYKFISLTTAST